MTHWLEQARQSVKKKPYNWLVKRSFIHWFIDTLPPQDQELIKALALYFLLLQQNDDQQATE
jgi:hypothetical protein